MPSFLAYFAPLALLLPAAGSDDGGALDDDQANLDPKRAEQIAKGANASKVSREIVLAPRSVSLPIQQQVRIERRVIVRIAPQSPRSRANLVADLPSRAPSSKLVERKTGKCIPVSSIAGVQTSSGSKLLLYLRDRRVLTVKLEKSCRSRDFYSGFYVEKNKDGKLCVDRDELHSRSGAKCEVERMRQLVRVSQ
ncbi:MAG: hypothetical protein ABJP34_07560 [Erythrobacter sp.]